MGILEALRFSEQEIVENHTCLMERNALFRRYGYDTEESVAFVLSEALLLPGPVLEIGSGKGRFLAALLRHASRVATIDLDFSEQRFARLNVAYGSPAGKAEFLIADAGDLPFGEGAFHSAVSMNALHHMMNLPRILDELLRVVRPQGKIVLADFSEEGFAIFDRIHLHEGRSHERIQYSFEDLVDYFTAKKWFAVLRHGGCQKVLIASRAPAEG